MVAAILQIRCNKARIFVMLPRAKHHKRNHLKHPGHDRQGATGDRSWLMRFWLLLGAFVLISAGAIYYYYSSQEADEDQDAYVSVKIKTMVGNDQIVICNLTLVIDPEQERGVRNRQQMLEAVVSSSLAEVYQRKQRPDMTEVRQALYFAINQKLPRKLKIHDLLIQDLLIGAS